MLFSLSYYEYIDYTIAHKDLIRNLNFKYNIRLKPLLCQRWTGIKLPNTQETKLDYFRYELSQAEVMVWLRALEITPEGRREMNYWKAHIHKIRGLILEFESKQQNGNVIINSNIKKHNQKSKSKQKQRQRQIQRQEEEQTDSLNKLSRSQRD